MTTVRPALPSELPSLAVIPGADERNAATSAYLTMLFEAACTRPEWCLVATSDDDTPVGSVVLWSPPGRDIPMDIVLFEPHDRDTGALLLAEAAALARGLGVERQRHVLDEPAQAPQFQHDLALRAAVLAAAGFTLERDGCRFRWGPAAKVPPQDDRLTWRSLAELGAEPFIDLLENVLQETSDAIFQAEVAEHGPRGTAEMNFEDALDFEHDPSWYEVGYDSDGTPAALSLPARNATHPIISLVGVAPAHRGKGYATAVVARGTKILVDNGATEIRGDCDIANIAMFKAFVACGYENFANRKMFGRHL